MKTKLVPPRLLLAPLLATACPADANLIAYWPFEEGEGQIAADVVGGFDATINGGTWTDNAKVAQEHSTEPEVRRWFATPLRFPQRKTSPFPGG